MLNAIRTDLSLLLECLKYQMKCPDSQKQALLTIVSICQQNDQNVDFLKEIGGVSFIYNLSRASLHPNVKETALFTLSSLAEFNESCKQSLCKEEIFCGLGKCMKQEVSPTQKRVAAYMVSVLVSNNKQGQILAKSSGCINILLKLFRGSFPVAEGPNEMLQLWTSVSSALCGCVNNPQNEENQHACLCAFSLVKIWVMQVSISRAELAQPICSFIGMTVANNSCAQEYFASVGGLVTLSDTFANVVSQCKDSSVACKLAVVISKTLSACIADNKALTPVLSELRLVPDLLLLLTSPNLSSRDQLAVLLTLGHCTDACVEHQSQLLLTGGLPLMISLLTEANDEEVRKAATFVLQTCKEIMKSDQTGECELQKHRQSAQEILKRIQHLECRQIGVYQLVKDVDLDQNTPPVLLRPPEHRNFWQSPVVEKVKGQNSAYEEEENPKDILEQSTNLTQHLTQEITDMQNQKSVQHVRRQIVRDFDEGVDPFQKSNTDLQHQNKTVVERAVTERKSELQMRTTETKQKETEGDETELTVKMKTHLTRSRSMDDFANRILSQATDSKIPEEGDRDVYSPDIFKYPAPMKTHQHRFVFTEDELSLCSELLDSEIERILITPVASKPSKLRCAGCVRGMDEVNSRSVGAVLYNCKSLCDFHLVLQWAEDGLRKRIQHERAVQRPDCIKKRSLEVISKHISSLKRESKAGNTHRPNRCDSMTFISLTPLKRLYETEGSKYQDVSYCQKNTLDDDKQNLSCRQRERKDYSSDELSFLTEGVRRFGHSWNTILWAYPFQDGRTNVDLARKYRKLKLCFAQAPDLRTQDTAEEKVH